MVATQMRAVKMVAMGRAQLPDPTAATGPSARLEQPPVHRHLEDAASDPAVETHPLLNHEVAWLRGYVPCLMFLRGQRRTLTRVMQAKTEIGIKVCRILLQLSHLFLHPCQIGRRPATGTRC